MTKNIAYLLARDNWEAVEVMDNWCYVYDRMPPRMKIIVDLKISGMGNKEIAKRCGCTVNNICNHVLKAKKRFLRGENIL